MTKDELFMEIDNERKLELWNEYCEEMNDYDNMIYVNGPDFLEMTYSNDLWTLAKAIAYGDYIPTYEYVGFDGNGNLKSYFTINDVINHISINDEYIEYAIANYNK